MELTQIKYNSKSNAFVDLYGNILRKCSKCNVLKNHENFNGTECKRCKYLSEKSKGGKLYLQRKNKAVKKHLAIKNANKPTKEQKEKQYYANNDGKYCKVYILKCLITGELYISNKYTQIPFNTSIEADYANSLNLAKTIKAKGKHHKCSQCNNAIDLSINGRCYSNNLVFCSSNCTKIHVKETKHNRIHLRRVRKSINSERVSRKKVFIKDNFTCYICKDKVFLYDTAIEMQTKDNAATIDHVIALANGGYHNYNNIKTCCRQCNSNKRDL